VKPTKPPKQRAKETNMITPFKVVLENLEYITERGDVLLIEVEVRGTMYPYRGATLYGDEEGGPEIEELLVGSYADEEGVRRALSRGDLDRIEVECGADLHDLTVEALAPWKH
jgi:hypothetical protein